MVFVINLIVFLTYSSKLLARKKFVFKIVVILNAGVCIVSGAISSIAFIMPQTVFAANENENVEYQKELISTDVDYFIDEETGLKYQIVFEEYIDVPKTGAANINNAAETRSLFPEYTLSTTQSIIDQVRASQIKVDFIDRFYQEKVYQEALAQKINSAWSIKNYDQLFIS